MRRFLYFLFRLHLLAGFFAGIFQPSNAQTSLLDSIINPSTLRQVLNVLASDSMQGRFTGTEHAIKAAVFIAEEFNKAGAQPIAGNEGYLKAFVARHETIKIGVNVMAGLPGKTKPDEVIIFSAHYDHVGTASTNPGGMSFKGTRFWSGDTIFNGANDNASGVAALITLAHYFGRLGSNERTLLFIAFSGEELGLLGSQVIASSVLADSIIAVVNIEMIGRGLSRGKKRAYVTGPYFSDLQKILNKKLREISPELFGKKFFYNDPFHDEKLFYRSDNYSFAKRGIPAHTIMASSPEDPYYHSPDDEISTLDIDLMAHLIKAIALSCSGLVSGIDTPSRIKPRLLESR